MEYLKQPNSICQENHISFVVSLIKRGENTIIFHPSVVDELKMNCSLLQMFLGNDKELPKKMYFFVPSKNGWLLLRVKAERGSVREFNLFASKEYGNELKENIDWIKRGIENLFQSRKGDSRIIFPEVCKLQFTITCSFKGKTGFVACFHLLKDLKQTQKEAFSEDQAKKVVLELIEKN
jgi:hypothetical protein